MRRVGLVLVVMLVSSGIGRVAGAADTAPREIEIVVENGYTPSRVTVQEGEVVRLTFLRKDYSGCTKEVVFPSLGIKKDLPVNKRVSIDLPAQKAGEASSLADGFRMVRDQIASALAQHGCELIDTTSGT